MIRGKKRDGVREYAEYLSSNCCGMILIHRVTVEERFLRVAPPSPSTEGRGADLTAFDWRAC